jgi:hypothetical protein
MRNKCLFFSRLKKLYFILDLDLLLLYQDQDQDQEKMGNLFFKYSLNILKQGGFYANL